MVYISLKEYLGKLTAQEQRRPKSQQHKVPSIAALAADVGIHPVNMSRIMNGHVKQLKLETADAIIKAMRLRGFPMEISDLIQFTPNERAV